MTQTTLINNLAAYFIVGWGTEASPTKSPYLFTTPFTRVNANGSVTKGGVSVGVFQVDLGQRDAQQA